MPSSTKRTKSAAILRLKQELSHFSICTMEEPQLRHGVAFTSLPTILAISVTAAAQVAILVIQDAVKCAPPVALRVLNLA